MLRLAWVTALLTAACSFTPAGDAPGDDVAADAPDGDAPPARDARDVDAAIDARPVDAPPPCPATYTAGYRSITTAVSWRDAERDCEDDAPGLTHLVVIDDATELVTVNGLVSASSVGDAWVGVVRDPAATQAEWRWRWVTGGTASFLPWEADQPDNASGNQLVVVLIAGSGQLRDIDISQVRNAVCECDRRPPMNADYQNP